MWAKDVVEGSLEPQRPDEDRDDGRDDQDHDGQDRDDQDRDGQDRGADRDENGAINGLSGLEGMKWTMMLICVGWSAVWIHF